jgi:nucleotide-binding universal stress UspA family protein
MKNLELNTWLVALDKTEMDYNIIKHVHFWEKILKPKHITFVHIRKESENWDSGDNTHFNKMVKKERELDHKWIELMNERIKSNGADTPFDVKVNYGNSFDRVLEICHKDKINLVIAGKKQKSESAGTLSEEFARRLPASFLLIPENAQSKCDNIMIASDFSDYSSYAISYAANLVSTMPNKIQLHIANVYSVPTGYHYIGKTFEECGYDMQKHAQNKMDRQLKTLNLNDIMVHFHLKKESHSAKHIFDMSNECNADLVVFGAKGATETAYNLIGSTASRMLRFVGKAPLLIIKKPGESYSFLKALGQIIEPT